MYRPREWLWVDSNGTDGKRQPAVTFRDFKSFRRYRGLKPNSLKTVAQKLPFVDTTHTGKFSQMFSDSIHHSQIHFLCANFMKFGRLKSAKLCVIYWQKEKKIFWRSRSRFCVIALKICHEQPQTTYSEFLKFHPNPFTSGGVIAERVIVFQMRHKVIPVLREASSPSKKTVKQQYLLHMSS